MAGCDGGVGVAVVDGVDGGAECVGRVGGDMFDDGSP